MDGNSPAPVALLFAEDMLEFVLSLLGIQWHSSLRMSRFRGAVPTTFVPEISQAIGNLRLRRIIGNSIITALGSIMQHMGTEDIFRNFLLLQSRQFLEHRPDGDFFLFCAFMVQMTVICALVGHLHLVDVVLYVTAYLLTNNFLWEYGDLIWTYYQMTASKFLHCEYSGA